MSGLLQLWVRHLHVINETMPRVRSTTYAATAPPASIAKQASRSANVVKHVCVQPRPGQNLEKRQCANSPCKAVAGTGVQTVSSSASHDLHEQAFQQVRCSKPSAVVRLFCSYTS